MGVSVGGARVYKTEQPAVLESIYVIETEDNVYIIIHVLYIHSGISLIRTTLGLS